VEKEEEEDRRNHRAKMQWRVLFHRAAIIKKQYTTLIFKTNLEPVYAQEFLR